MAKINWRPGDDYVIRLSDSTGIRRTPADLSFMVKRMDTLANMYGFKVCASSTWNAARKVALGEQKMLDSLNKKESTG